jgi:hypothetical protein
MTIYRCSECGLESSDKDLVDKCIQDHTKLKLDRIEQRIARLEGGIRGVDEVRKKTGSEHTYARKDTRESWREKIRSPDSSLKEMSLETLQELRDMIGAILDEVEMPKALERLGLETADLDVLNFHYAIVRNLILKSKAREIDEEILRRQSVSETRVPRTARLRRHG